MTGVVCCRSCLVVIASRRRHRCRRRRSVESFVFFSFPVAGLVKSLAAPASPEKTVGPLSAPGLVERLYCFYFFYSLNWRRK